MKETSASTSNLRTLRFCSRCAKPIGNNRVSSLTGWLFQETFCQCRLQLASEPSDRSVTPAGSLFGDAPGDKDTFDLPDFGQEYEVLERIGKGGMGCVYKVRDVELDRFLAIKVLHDDLKEDQQAVSRFEREAKAALKLMHTNLVPVFSYGKSKVGAPYLVMDFVDGMSLETKLKNEAYLDVSAATAIFIQICDALTHAHQHGIIHRDLKPGNIIITKDADGREVAKLVDFGIAKVRSGMGRETQNLTQTGDVFGSPHYMSPEQCLGFDQDSRSDLYSLGCVMYECLSGKPPFEGHNAVQLIAKHLSSEAPPLRICDISQDGKVNERLAEIVSKCLHKDPEDRYLSLELLSVDLKNLTEQVTGGGNNLLVLPRKLSILRSSFLLCCAASILSIGFVAAPMPLPFLVLLPICAAVSGALLINGRLIDFVSRTQFQSRTIRDAAGQCVAVLVVCHWMLALCAACALAIPFLHLAHQAIPVQVCFLGMVVGIIVWTGFLQSIESADIQGSLSTGKVMHAISLSLLIMSVAFSTQFFGAGVANRNKSELQIETSVTNDVLKFSDNVASAQKDELSVKPMPIGVWEDRPKSTISSIEYNQGKKCRIFRIPKGVSLGVFTMMGRKFAEEIPAQGLVMLPAEEKVGLRMRSYACSQFAPLLRQFADNDIDSLTINGGVSAMAMVHNVDDVMFFIAGWKSLRSLTVLGGDLSDYGLNKVKAFSHLTNLVISNTRVTAAGMIALPQLRTLSELGISGIPKTGQIIKALNRSKSLESLSVSSSDLTGADLAELARFPNLKALQLDECSAVNDQSIKAFAGNKRLISMSLIGDKVTAKALPYLATLKSLRILCFSRAGWSEREIAALQKALSGCRFRYTNVTDRSI